MGAFKECDIRGVVGREITEDLALALGQCFGRMAGPGPIVVGRDVRPSSEFLRTSLIEGLLRAGKSVLDLGLLPTPAFSWHVVFGQRDGVMVTASHNPPEYNGFKLVLGGEPVYGVRLQALSEALTQFPHLSSSERRGEVHRADGVGDYVKAILDKVKREIPGATRKTRVVADMGNGCAALTAGPVLRALGVEVEEMFAKLDGRFPNRDPNPAKPGTLALLGEEVRSRQAQWGVGFDGDGDRACFVDEKGEAIEPEKAMLLLAEKIIAPGEAVVYDAKCSRVVPQFIASLGGRPVMERSGYAFMRERMKTENAILGGELSGHTFFRTFRGADDALYAACLLGSLVSELNFPLSEKVKGLPQSSITPDLRIHYGAEGILGLLNRIQRHFEESARVTLLDGVRVEFEDGWALVRRSVTEPVITMRFEGRDDKALCAVVDRILCVIPELDSEVRKRL